MSTLKFRRATLGLVFCTLLSGCLAELPANGQAGSVLKAGGEKRSFALASAAIVPERVIGKGPAGYCIDKRSLKTGRMGGFALLAPCAALDARADSIGLEAAILTLQVQPMGLVEKEISAEALAQAFASEKPIYLENGDGISLVHLASGGETLIPQSDPKHWRGALKFNGFLIGLAVYSEKGGAAAGEAGKMLLIDFAEAVLSASPIAVAE
jgi:hypothetical protein